MHLLIIDEDAKYYGKRLTAKFPELVIHAAETEDEVGSFIQKANILLIKRISNDLMKEAASLEWIQSVLTGVDYLLNLPSLREEVIVTSTRGMHGPQVSELTILLMLALSREFPRVVKNQETHTWDRWPGKLLWKKKAGILGVGAIGSEIAQKCKAFGMTVHGITSIKREMEWVDHPYGPDGLMEVLREVDYFINVIPSLPETRNMIGAEELAAMKPTAYFINVGRGETVDEDALVNALKTGAIAGAGLDVYCQEPLPEDSPFWELENAIVCSHLGGMSDIYADQALPIIEENMGRFLKGERKDLVNLIKRKKKP
ncbi:MAG: D-2-hydroxyacid dehydrogenase [Deltaproteobacteria bacterium]|nr:D-2-hydroxyacid dehydrogenase [Deltaproteobacteria bacterium]